METGTCEECESGFQGDRCDQGDSDIRYKRIDKFFWKC